MTKEVKKEICSECESKYRLMFDLEDTSGFPKFCPFCGTETCDIRELEEDGQE